MEEELLALGGDDPPTQDEGELLQELMELAGDEDELHNSVL